MSLPLKVRDLPGRVATGAFILHSGLEKLHADEAHTAGAHGMAVGAYPFLRKIPPQPFMRMLAIGEITVGAALLTPLVPTALAGAALTAFSGALVTMYARTPALHQPGSLWPSANGTGVAKDVWMLGIGLGFLAERMTGRRA